MGQRKKSLIRIICLIFASVFMLCGAKKASANTLTDTWSSIVKNSNIFFWNPNERGWGEDCSDFGEDPYNPTDPTNPSDPTEPSPDQPDPPQGSDYWDGHCSSIGTYIRNGRMEKFFQDIYTVSKSNGLPWEAMMAQMIQESGLGAHEACPYNPLGLKSFSAYPPACDARKHATFKSYQEAFQYYVDSIIRVREAKGKYPNNPYAYVAYLQTEPNKYAQATNYVNKTSGIICAIQKWAQSTGKPTSSVTYDRYKKSDGTTPGTSDENPAGDDGGEDETPGTDEPVQRDEDGTCPGDDEREEDDNKKEEEDKKEIEDGGSSSDAEAIMNRYRNIQPRNVSQNPSLKQFNINSTNSCTSDLENCVAFVKWYIHNYTSSRPTSIGNGSQVVNTLINKYGWKNGGHTPKVGAVFSTASGRTMCGLVKCGHTGVVLAINYNTVYIGEAGCSQPFSWTGVHPKTISAMSSKSYTYAYPPGA